MKKTYRILSLLLVFLLVCGGCGKKAKQKKKVYDAYECDFAFEDRDTVVSVMKNGETVMVSNAFEKAAVSFYQALKTDQLKPIGKPAGITKQEGISLQFGSLSLAEPDKELPDFEIKDDDILIFFKNGKKQYFKTVSGVYEEIAKKSDALLKDKSTYYKEKNTDDQITIFSLLKKEGAVAKKIKWKGKVVLYQKNILILQEDETAMRRFYDRDKAVLSDAVPLVSDYRKGYLCYIEKKKLKLISTTDKKFSYSGKDFEQTLSDDEQPFTRLVFLDHDTVEISYHTNADQLYTQKYDLSPFFKDYKAKIEKEKAAAADAASAPASVPKPNPPENTTKYEYISPSYSTENGIPPFNAKMEAKLMKLDNTPKGYGWKGSEDRQGYYAKYNAYATGNRNKNTVYLTFDEGYEYNDNTNKILNILAKKKVKAVFFVTMDFAKKHPDLIRRMIKEGHAVGNHSTTHPSFPSLSLKNAYNEILNLHNYILKNFGYTMKLFRFPEGVSSDRTLALVSEMGYVSVFWNCAYNDWNTASQPSPATTRSLVANNTKNGTIYLFHAVSNTNVSMLAEIIDTVRSSGYQFGLFGG